VEMIDLGRTHIPHICKYFAFTIVVYMLRQALLNPEVQVNG
jgi:hypothetical protein